MSVRTEAAAACVVALAAAGGARAADYDVDTAWIDTAAVAAGEVVYQTGKADRLTATIDVALVIDAPAEAIWNVLTACEVAPEYVPHVESCRHIETVDDGSAELFVQEVKPAFFLPSFEHVFRLEYLPYERIEVSRVSGPLNHMQGSWTLLPRDDGRILLVHELEIDPGLPVPRFFVRNSLRRDMPRVLAAVRERSERRGDDPL